jgi:glutathione S-transferase
VVPDIPVLAAYQARCEARPAFKRALAAQLAPFERYAPVAA